VARKWQLQEAKNRLSEVVDLAINEGPQTVTRRGEDVVVIVSKADFEKGRRSRTRGGTFVEFMRGLGFVGANLDIQRSSDTMRDVDF
jgi:prevent-host-death family protein